MSNEIQTVITILIVFAMVLLCAFVGMVLCTGYAEKALKN